MGLSDKPEQTGAPKPKFVLGIRHLQTLLTFLGLFLMSFVRVSMSLAIVAMTDPSQENTFDWPLSTQNIILSSYNWGYIVLLVPSGELARRFGGMPLFTTCVAVNSVVCLLLPLSAYYGGWKAVCACRIIQGLAQGLLMPSLMQLMSRWFPVEEKGRLLSFTLSGAQLGTTVQLLIAGYIADVWGWPVIFYVDGIAGIVMTIVYILVLSSSPQTSKIISEEERNYIQQSLQQVGVEKKLKTPWKAILTSIPFWALITSCAGFNWGHWSLLTQIPIYMNSVLGVNIRSNGLLSAIPYFGMYLLCFPIGYISDYALKKKWMSVTNCRKMFNTVSSVGPAAALIALCFAPLDVAVTVTILTVAVSLTAAFFLGDSLVYLDMSPNFASVMIGFNQFIVSVIALNAPLVVNLLIDNEEDPREWHNVFYLAAGIYIVTNTVFLFFGTSQRQSWNEPSDDEEKEAIDEKA